MKLYTIGFTQKSASDFFSSLKNVGIKRLIDVRLNNSSQLSAFAKKNDLKYFLNEICGASYIHSPELAPTQAMLDEYKKYKGGWDVYQRKFLDLMSERHVEHLVDKMLFAEPSVLLCSELKAEHCHRRLVVEYLSNFWPDLEAIHL